jgi:hypothetical protein
VTSEVQAQVENLRERTFERPIKVEFSNKEDFIAYAKEHMEKMQPVEEFKADEAMARLLGLVPAELDLLLVNGVAR